MQRQVWQMYTLQAGPRAGAARNTGDRGVLPRGMEMQVWQQVIHAMNIINFLSTMMYFCSLWYKVHISDSK